jgi:hypothetical protein
LFVPWFFLVHVGIEHITVEAAVIIELIKTLESESEPIKIIKIIIHSVIIHSVIIIIIHSVIITFVDILVAHVVHVHVVHVHVVHVHVVHVHVVHVHVVHVHVHIVHVHIVHHVIIRSSRDFINLTNQRQSWNIGEENKNLKWVILKDKEGTDGDDNDRNSLTI